MEHRRAGRTVSDPKVRHVGFFTPGASSPHRTQSGPPDPISSSPPAITRSPTGGNSLSPVMIPPPRHTSAPLSPLRRDTVPVGSYNASDFLLATSPTASASFSDDITWSGRGGRQDLASSGSFPGGGFDMPAASSVPASGLTTVSVVNLPPGLSEKSGVSIEVQNDRQTNSKSLKEKTTKAERRALQEAQRAAKAAAKAEGGKTVPVSVAASYANAKPAKPAKAQSQKNDNAAVAATEKKGGDRPLEKDRKKDVPQPRMQYDDKSRVDKAKKRAVVKQTEARNRVELFRHLPQYEHGTQLPDLESKFFQLEPMHPAVYKVGLQYLSGDIGGGNARCIAMLQAFQEVIKDYSTPPEKTLVRDLTAKIGSYVSFLIECRPLSISMGNAIRFLKSRIAKLPLTQTEFEAKATLHADIDRFIYEKIILADKVIVRHAVTKIRDGDVLLTFGSSSAVEMILLHAHELGKQFRVVIVDSRPKLEGQLLLRRLVGFQYLSGDIGGGNARCIAMLQAFQEVIKDYSTPPEKTLVRDLTAKIGSYVSFLIECRPLSISMGNAIRFLKSRIAKLPLTQTEFEAKATLHADIDRFIYEKIILADKVIVRHAVTKIRDGDVLLTFGSSSAVEMILLHAHELGKQFRVVIVDSRPKLEGQLLLRRLVRKGISCTYTHINAVSYIMHEVTRVFLGASSVLSNGTVYSRVGTACVAMVAHAFRVPVLVCCEAYKFHERVQLDSICSNELGDPDAISKVHGREEINFLDGCASKENLQLLNVIYDATPSDYVSMIITDYGMVPPTSVPVIVREYRREHLWI